MIAALILAAGAAMFGVALLYAAIAVHRLTARTRAVEKRLANLAQINTDLRKVNTVPDAATPALAVAIDDRLHCGCPPREPIYGCVVCGHQRCATHRDQDHGCAQTEAQREPLPPRKPVVPPHVDPPYVPTEAEVAALADIEAHLEAS